MMEIATFVLILCLVLILTIYNRRQAHALEYMARLEEDRAAREIRDRREHKAGQLLLEPLHWLEGLVNPLLDAPVNLTDTGKRVVPEVGTVELRAGMAAGCWSRPRRFPRCAATTASCAHNGKGAAARLSEFAATPLLGNRWRI